MRRLKHIFAGLSIVLFFLTTIAAFAETKGNTTIRSFNKAKKILLKQVYSDRSTTFYCGSTFSDSKEIAHTKGYIPKKAGKRAHRLEWEHVVPAHAFGQSFPEWRDGHPDCVNRKGKAFKGRKCAEKANLKFRYMQADMHNLVPAIGEVNGLRSNYGFAMIPGEKREFGACDMEIENRQAEPPPVTRGNIARTYMYMDHAYPGHGIISKKTRKQLQEILRVEMEVVDPKTLKEGKIVTDFSGLALHKNRYRANRVAYEKYRQLQLLRTQSKKEYQNILKRYQESLMAMMTDKLKKSQRFFRQAEKMRKKLETTSQYLQ